MTVSCRCAFVATSVFKDREKLEDHVSGEQEPLSMKRNMLWNSAGSFTNLLAQWLITVLVVRIASGYDAAGLYSLAVSVYGIFAPVAQYRMYTYQISDTRHENTVGEYFTLRVITNGIALVACFGYALLTCPLSAVPAIMLYGLFKSAALLIDVFHACDQRHYRMDYIGISLAMQGVTSLAIFALAFSLTQNLEVTLALMSLALLVIGLVYDMPRSNGFEKLRLGITWRKTRHLLLKCLPIVIGALAMAAAVSAPRQYLFDAMGEAALGVYASVAAPVAIIQTGASYIYYPLIGYFADYYDRGEKRKLMGLLLRATGGIALVGIVCAVLLELFGAPLLELFFANNIGQYAYLLVPMIVSAMITAYVWFLNDLLIAVRDFRGNLIGSIVPLVVALACMVPFVQWWGMNGVSFTAIASYLAAAVSMGASFLACLKKSGAVRNADSVDGSAL